MFLYSLQEVSVSSPISLSLYSALSLKNVIQVPVLFFVSTQILGPFVLEMEI